MERHIEQITLVLNNHLAPAIREVATAVDRVLRQFSITYREGYYIVNKRGRNRLVRTRRR